MEPLFPNGRRPYDLVKEAGEPANPIDFPEPVFLMGLRRNVKMHDERKNAIVTKRNVLLRDFSLSRPDCSMGVDGAVYDVEAYSRVPGMTTYAATGGYVEICNVLRAKLTDNNYNNDIVFYMTNRRVAVKVCSRLNINRPNNRAAEDRGKEIGAMQLIGDASEDVICCIEVLLVKDQWNIVMPEGGIDLYNRIFVSNGGTKGLQEVQARNMFRQIVRGVRYMHSQGVCHFDLSPENVMCKKLNDTDSCTVIDMGMAIRVPYTDPNSLIRGGVTDIENGTHKRLIQMNTSAGKKYYKGPEISPGSANDDSIFDGEAVDVWALGTLLYCMLTGRASYKKADTSDALFCWMAYRLHDLLRFWDLNLSGECQNLLQQMLQVDPRLRFTLDEVEQHPWWTANI